MKERKIYERVDADEQRATHGQDEREPQKKRHTAPFESFAEEMAERREYFEFLERGYEERAK